MEKEIRRINPLSLALVSGTSYAIITAVVGILILIIPAAASVLSLAAAGNHEMAGFFAFLFGYGLVMGILGIIVATILAFAVGFIGGAISAIIYNFVASKVGGVKIELVDG